MVVYFPSPRATGSTGDSVWFTWNANVTYNTNTYGDDLIYATDLTMTNSTVWTNWVVTGSNTYNPYQHPAPAQRPTPMEQEEFDRREARRLKQCRERDRREAEARRRAELLLMSLLTEEQRETWVDGKYFDVVGSEGGLYRIENRVAGNVFLIGGEGDELRPTKYEELCAHPPTRITDDEGKYLGVLPVEDVLVAQLLTLRTDEEGFREVANIRRLRDRPTDRLQNVMLNIAA